jgi:hypothetical protein
VLSYFLSYGIDPDFNNRWFITVGNTIVSSQIFLIVAPIVESVVTIVLVKKQELIGGSDNFFRDKNLPYSLDAKYSAILSSVFVTMMFGPAIPILFPIACAYFIVLLTMEGYMLRYYYKEIPAYDNKLNDQALKTLLFAPFVLYSFGYWFLSNKQLLGTDHLVPKISMSAVYDCQHSLWAGIYPHGTM